MLLRMQYMIVLWGSPRHFVFGCKEEMQVVGRVLEAWHSVESSDSRVDREIPNIQDYFLGLL